MQAIINARYPAAEGAGDVEVQAAEAKDWEYFRACARVAEAERDQAGRELPWLLAERPASPRDSLRRIQDICTHCPDLYTAIQTMLVTHPGIPRNNLAAAIKQLHPNLAQISAEDVVGLITAAWNGGQQGFEAVLRTRKGAARTSGASLWSKHDE
ncbi:MAG TPA: hypothetical protein VGE47_14425 [Burkholderiaceae bacterium]